MDGSEESLRSLAKSLRRNQRKHEVQLTKVEKARARLERRKSKLEALEAMIADQERRLAEPRRADAPRQDGEGPFRHACLIFNPSSGREHEDRGERLAEVIRALRAHGIDPHLGVKTSGKAAHELARRAVEAGHSLVIVAAGDGTITEVASELIGSQTTLGIVPVGTMNNVARSLGIPLAIDDACALIGMGTTRHVDVGRVVTSGSGKSEIFLECAGIGLGALLAAAGQAVEKHRWSHLPGLLRRFKEEHPVHVKVEMDEVTVEANTHLVTVANAPMFGNNLLAAPAARMDDGFLDVCLYDGLGEAELTKHFLSASNGKVSDLATHRARHVRISAEDPLEVDAGLVQVPARRVIEIESVPGALSMIVGNGIALSVPVESAPKATVLGPAPHPNGVEEAKTETAVRKA
jgi:YegS/Rv2252/BmrU family lipid kinase